MFEYQCESSLEIAKNVSQKFQSKGDEFEMQKLSRELSMKLIRPTIKVFDS